MWKFSLFTIIVCKQKTAFHDETRNFFNENLGIFIALSHTAEIIFRQINLGGKTYARVDA